MFNFAGARGVYFRAHALRFEWNFCIFYLFLQIDFQRANAGGRIFARWLLGRKNTQFQLSKTSISKKMIFADPEPYTKNHFFEKLKITKPPISSQNRRENVARARRLLSKRLWDSIP